MIYVTHDRVEVMTLADKIIGAGLRQSRRSGRWQAAGLYHYPADALCREASSARRR